MWPSLASHLQKSLSVLGALSPYECIVFSNSMGSVFRVAEKRAAEESQAAAALKAKKKSGKKTKEEIEQEEWDKKYEEKIKAQKMLSPEKV